MQQPLIFQPKKVLGIFWVHLYIFKRFFYS